MRRMTRHEARYARELDDQTFLVLDATECQQIAAHLRTAAQRHRQVKALEQAQQAEAFAAGIEQRESA